METFTVSFMDFYFSYDIAGFDPVHALRGATISGIRNGEIVCVVGPNASGKSTLLDLIAERRKRLNKFGKIEVSISGREAKYSELVKAYVPQKPYEGLVPDLTIAENAVLRGIVCRKADFRLALSTEKRKTIMDKCYEYGLNEISQRLDMPPSALSGGQQQLLNILASIVAKPHLIILDEPTSKLDEVNSIRVWGILYKAAREENLAILCVTHDVAMVSRIADRIAYFEDGKVVNEVRLRNPKEERFIGEIRRVPSCNKLPNQFLGFNENWWDPNTGSLFGDDYYNGDNSDEGYLSGRSLNREERTNREVNGLILLC